MKSIRLEATKYIWTGFAVIMGLIFGAGLLGYEIGVGQIVVGIVLSIATFLSTGTIWNWGAAKLESEFIEGEQAAGEKAKRQQRGLNRLLDQLSDDELLDLREELRRQKYASDGELL